MESHLECGCVVTQKRGHVHTQLCKAHQDQVFHTVWSSDIVLNLQEVERHKQQVLFGLKKVS